MAKLKIETVVGRPMVAKYTDADGETFSIVATYGSETLELATIVNGNRERRRYVGYSFDDAVRSFVRDIFGYEDVFRRIDRLGGR
jgi:hypothetical protein